MMSTNDVALSDHTDYVTAAQDVKSVINYDAARSVESHIHRIGRTGRMQVSHQPHTTIRITTHCLRSDMNLYKNNNPFCCWTLTNKFLSSYRKMVYTLVIN